MKGQAGVLDNVRVDVALHQEWVSHHPFGAPELRSSFTPRRQRRGGFESWREGAA